MKLNASCGWYRLRRLMNGGGETPNVLTSKERKTQSWLFARSQLIFLNQQGMWLETTAKAEELLKCAFRIRHPKRIVRHLLEIEFLQNARTNIDSDLSQMFATIMNSLENKYCTLKIHYKIINKIILKLENALC